MSESATKNAFDSVFGLCDKVSENVHCVPISSVFFQENSTCSKTNQISKKFHWVITNCLTFVSRAKKIRNLRHFTCFASFEVYHESSKIF